MKKAAAKEKTTTGEKNASVAPLDGRVFALQFLDTTWRVALPITLLCYIGIQLDKHYGTNPLWVLVGLFASLGLSTLLVYRQLKVAYPDLFKKDGGN